MFLEVFVHGKGKLTHRAENYLHRFLEALEKFEYLSSTRCHRHYRVLARYIFRVDFVDFVDCVRGANNYRGFGFLDDQRGANVLITP